MQMESGSRLRVWEMGEVCGLGPWSLASVGLEAQHKALQGSTKGSVFSHSDLYRTKLGGRVREGAQALRVALGHKAMLWGKS